MKPVSTEDEALVGVAEAAQIIGRSEDRVRKLCQAGKLPFLQPFSGAHYRFRVSELHAWLRGEWEPDGD